MALAYSAPRIEASAPFGNMQLHALCRERCVEILAIGLFVGDTIEAALNIAQEVLKAV